MKKKKTILILLLVIIILVIGTCIWIKNLKEDNKQSNLMMEQIKNENNKLEQSIEKYNNNRKDLASLLENSYTEEFNTQYEQVIASLTKIDDTIKEVQKTIHTLDKKCKNQVYSNKEVNQVCSTYQEYYEKIVNTYINDSNQVNQIIEEYNQEKMEKLELYVPNTVTEYIDYNIDGVYLERDEQ